MKLKINIKPISINIAFQGRRFKTKKAKDFEQELFYILPKKNMIKGWVEINYKLYLKNWKMTDGDNCIKIMQDTLVKKGYIEDDRKIMRYVIEKIPSEKDRVEVEIKEYVNRK